MATVVLAEPSDSDSVELERCPQRFLVLVWFGEQPHLLVLLAHPPLEAIVVLDQSFAHEHTGEEIRELGNRIQKQSLLIVANATDRD